MSSEAKSALVSPESLHEPWAKQGNATVNVPDMFGPIFSGEDLDFKPLAVLAKLRKEKTGVVPNAFQFRLDQWLDPNGKPLPSNGAVGLVYGRPGDPKREFSGGYGLAHIDAKHPGNAEKIVSFLQNPALRAFSRGDKITLWNGKDKVGLSVFWDGNPDRGQWVITSFKDEEAPTGKELKRAPSAVDKIPSPSRTVDGDSGSSSPREALNSNDKSTPESVKEQNPNELSKGEYFPTARSILLWANADRSTFLHETGHWFLGARVGLALQLKNLETLTDSQKHLVSAVEDAVKWLGYDSLKTFVGASIEERRPAEERFARTFEQYLKDGRAPSAGLQSLFRRFANWLKAIYGFMTAVPGSQMSDDVRRMFDRLFVAEEQQTEARLRYDLYQALNREDFSEEEAYQAYLALMKESIDAANEDLTARGMRDMRYLSGPTDRILA
ncbi:hypothetical protein MUN46_010875 [Mesosutterella sp. AGMB02718]|uniref:Uncharacterized protein n=1 Tax=Mesosutterella faecium TaxID=2925194 RepID=A0ABT7IPY9_9BURK|nr:hypothetical protein [Mesosutterella sp. AGMB02718]MDL2060439.1 hypothetical protein [Mesosutterella sp. AGMB02718]